MRVCCLFTPLYDMSVRLGTIMRAFNTLSYLSMETHGKRRTRKTAHYENLHLPHELPSQAKQNECLLLCAVIRRHCEPEYERNAKTSGKGVVGMDRLIHGHVLQAFHLCPLSTFFFDYVASIRCLQGQIFLPRRRLRLAGSCISRQTTKSVGCMQLSAKAWCLYCLNLLQFHR